MEAGGSDSNGREYKTADEMWKEQVGSDSKKTLWYQQGVSYWEVVIHNNHFFLFNQIITFLIFDYFV